MRCLRLAKHMKFRGSGTFGFLFMKMLSISVLLYLSDLILDDSVGIR